MCHKTRDLGILIDSEINFKEHIYNITASANQRAFLIKKCFLSKDTSSLVKAYKIYVRSLIEVSRILLTCVVILQYCFNN